MSMIDSYFEFYEKSIEEYGKQTVVLFQCGSFYESYEVDCKTEKIGNAKEMSSVCDILCTSKNKTDKEYTRTKPMFCGFKTTSLNKFLTKLLENGYTVVVVEQIENTSPIQRCITQIHNPCLYSSDLNLNTSNCLVSLLLEKHNNTVVYSIISLCNETNNLLVYESSIEHNKNTLNDTLENSISLVSSNPVQIIIHSNFECSFRLNNKGTNVNNKNIKQFSNVNYQNEFLKNIYKIENTMLCPIEFLGLEKYPLSTTNLLCIIDYINTFSLKYTKNISIPTVIELENEHLKLELNTLEQLNIKQVIKVIDNTQTVIGKRLLKSLLTRPFNDPDIIEQRLLLSDALYTIDYLTVKDILKTVCDIQKFHRKMSLNTLSPNEFEVLTTNYISIQQLSDILLDNEYLKTIVISPLHSKLFMDYIKDYTKTFNLIQMACFQEQNPSNFFNIGINDILDMTQKKIEEIHSKMESIRLKYDKFINTDPDKQFIKLVYTDIDAYHLVLTKLRFKSLEKACDIKFDVKTCNGSSCKVFTKELSSMSSELVKLNDLLYKEIQKCYTIKLEEYTCKYADVFVKLAEFIGILDVTLSNVITSTKNKYFRPTIVKGQESYIIAKDIRHPIIEQLIDTEYIPNDIELKNSGLLLLGINACGKSSLLRSIGINVILAQIGYYVSAREFVLMPFKKLISQVDLTDNLFKARSSFVNEIYGIKCILENAGPNTLVLIDEPTKGTEYFSSMAIVFSVIEKLKNTKCKFFITTHLHRITSQLQDVQIKHLSVIVNDNIIFERKLKDGDSFDLYGLEIAKNIIQDTTFIETAFSFRNELVKPGFSTKKSRYNSKLIMNHCKICDSKEDLETHHIKEQRNCDQQGFVNNAFYHKNKLFNLVCLCKNCHLQLTLSAS